MRLRNDELKSIFESAYKHKDIFTTQFKKELIKSDFTLNLASLTPWTAAEGQTLLTLAVLGAPTRKMISRQDGCKYIEELKYMDTSSGLVKYQKGFNPVGTTTITVKNVTVTKMQSQEVLYPEDLNDYSTQYSLRPGFNTDLPWETLYGEMKSKYISRDIEFYDWGTQSGGTNADSWAGLGHSIPAVVGGPDVWTTTGYTSKSTFSWAGFLSAGTYTDLMGIQSTMIEKLPEAIQGQKLTWFVSPAILRKMLAVLRDGPTGSGNYHIDVIDNDGTTSFLFPAYTNLEVVGVPGLSSENPNQWVATVITPSWNLVGLNDLVNEDEKFSIFWNPYEEKLQFSCHFKAGIDFYFPHYISFSSL